MHSDLAALAEAVEARGNAPLPAISAAEARERIVAGNALCSAGPELDAVDDLTIPTRDGTVGVRVYRHGSAQLGTLVYLHGGGWITGDLGYADEILRFLARDAALTVVSVDYRLAPEHPFPTPLQDAYAALVWASENVAGGGALMIGGDSAGGNLAAACSVLAVQEGGPQLDLQVLIYPVLDHDFDRSSYDMCATSFPLGRVDLVYCFDQYVPDAARRDSPLVSPARFEDPASLPPALMVVAGHDPLHDEASAYAVRLEQAMVPVSLLEYPALCHGFLRFTGAARACTTAREELTTAVKDAVTRVAHRTQSGETTTKADS
jgi:acetyl esterase